jgi:WD40 repeat protein
MQKISSIAWSPNSKKQAVAASDRVIYLFDDQGKK